ncbi:DUF1493 family protein [Salmonella enterica subsp. enterica serovar Enteritidis]|nr:hypothetical protein [Salmonella enterica subsp. enterica serovar Enteritidis]EBX6034463.1 hypothetical protein [Salmonella enterica subsp. enterica serovar Enteritidis]ECA3890017.1 DUF1493 family protein [Salmonella enterica subsp. enterica serovar Enteritidis]ECA3937979.1 DUF1493 family protein [Salmonella enterica subsp. enterica serovar Enteritidis]ECE8089247.1 DUF1493 family protein [Salmonella enterica subsp. enterica serovar Enteritidis]
MLTEKYDFRITDQMTIPLRPHWIANDSYREKCKMLVLNRSKGEIHKVDFSKLTDYIKEGDVICFNDSTIINHMFICKTRQNRLIKIVIEGFLPNYELVRSHDGIYLFKKKELTPSTDLDSDLRLEDDEALALMDDFFTTFNVDRGSFSITTYYPPEPPLKHLLNPFRKNDIPQVADFTIGMLIASARAGRWLYD